MSIPPKVKKAGKGKKANIKPAKAPAQGPIGNTTGLITPKPAPNLGGITKVPAQPETPEEKEFVENQLPKIKTWVNDQTAQHNSNFSTKVVGSLEFIVLK
jgi:hypothetical protein